MKMKTGHIEEYRSRLRHKLRFLDPDFAGIGCRSSIQPQPIRRMLIAAMQEEVSSGVLEAPSDQDFDSILDISRLEPGLRDELRDEEFLIRIYKEGLLG